MNSKKVDITKKSNIKCEHCKYWNKYSNWHCVNEESVKYGNATNYWNRCKCFQWRTIYVKDK